MYAIFEYVEHDFEHDRKINNRFKCDSKKGMGFNFQYALFVKWSKN